MTEQEPKNQPEKMSVDVEEIRMLMGLARRRLGKDEFAERQVAFVKHLKEKYPDWADRRSYHAIAGSSIFSEREEMAIDEDFPGDDSVVKFLKSLVS